MCNDLYVTSLTSKKWTVETFLKILKFLRLIISSKVLNSISNVQMCRTVDLFRTLHNVFYEETAWLLDVIEETAWQLFRLLISVSRYLLILACYNILLRLRPQSLYAYIELVLILWIVDIKIIVLNFSGLLFQTRNWQ